MEICVFYGGQTHCFVIPVVEPPVLWPRPGPGPINYPQMFQDGFILASVHKLVQNVGDANVRRAMDEGLAAAVKAMQHHAGEHVTIRLSEAGRG